jgi:hypothetical protein
MADLGYGSRRLNVDLMFEGQGTILEGQSLILLAKG